MESRMFECSKKESNVWGFGRKREASYIIQMSEGENCSHCQALGAGAAPGWQRRPGGV